MPTNDYSQVTELGGAPASAAQLLRTCSRYYFAGQRCEGKRDVLEVACGAGLGLGYLSRRAERVVGLDIDPTNLERARATYKGRPRVEIVEGDAERLPFPDASFDAVILFEAIYYLPSPERFVAEARRVLRPGGELMICTANRDLPDFNPSPFSHRYLNPPELAAMLRPLGFEVRMFGDSPVGPRTLTSRVVRGVKAFAVKLKLIPGSMRGKVLLKRLVFGKLRPLPAEIQDGLVATPPLAPIAVDQPNVDFYVLHCVAKAIV
jgi:SAM-dependent methyltransferase